jgi:transposase-like protein
MNPPTCPECGSEDTSPLKGQFAVFKCEECNEVFDEDDASSRERSGMHRERQRKWEDE